MRPTIMKVWMGGLLASALAMPAQAGWLTAESEHFVVTSDGRAETVSDYVRKLEAVS
jgi:hypothetical protein